MQTQYLIRIVTQSRFRDGRGLTEPSFRALVATELRIHPDVDTHRGCQVEAVAGQVRVGLDQLAEDRLRAMEIREGTIAFAEVPGYLRVAEQMTGESARRGMILGVDLENLLGFALRTSSQIQSQHGRGAFELHIGEQAQALCQVRLENHVAGSDALQTLEVGSRLFELGSRGRELTGSELKVAENDMVRAHAFEIID